MYKHNMGLRHGEAGVAVEWIYEEGSHLLDMKGTLHTAAQHDAWCHTHGWPACICILIPLFLSCCLKHRLRSGFFPPHDLKIKGQKF